MKYFSRWECFKKLRYEFEKNSEMTIKSKTFAKKELNSSETLYWNKIKNKITTNWNILIDMRTLYNVKSSNKQYGMSEEIETLESFFKNFYS